MTGKAIVAGLEFLRGQNTRCSGRQRQIALGSPAWSRYAQRFKAHIVNYADDLVVLGKAPSAEMLTAFESLMQRLKLTVNAEKTRCCRVPEEPIEFLGYRIGRNYRRDTGRAYIGTRPSQASVQGICRRVSEVTATRYGLLEPEVVVGRLNRLITGWGELLLPGPSQSGVRKRWTDTRPGGCVDGCRKHKVRSGKHVRFSDAKLKADHKLARLVPRTVSFPWAKRLETEPWRGLRHRHRESRRQQLLPTSYRHRASRRLYIFRGDSRK